MNMYPKYTNFGTKMQSSKTTIAFPPQQQLCQPGMEYNMSPRPISENKTYRGSGKLLGKVALITGGDSGIGRAVAYAFAKEGAYIAISYLNEHRDAKETQERIKKLGGKCLLLPGDLREEAHSDKLVNKVIQTFGHMDILVNNHAVQFPKNSILDITAEQLDTTFRTNIYPFFYLTKAALPSLPKNSSIINTTSITAYNGSKDLIDYSATKGAIVSFTRSLALSLASKQIRVNAVAPGPIWTPLIPASFSTKKITTFGNNTTMKRAGQPFELAATYVYLASLDSNYVSGQVLHVNGGMITES